MMMKNIQHIALIIAALFFISCEKEIEIERPASVEQLVVEASINQLTPTLNYVFVTKSIDYFKPDLSAGGITNATVHITEGRINGSDTIFDGTRTRFYNIYSIPGASAIIAMFDNPIINSIGGIYINPSFQGKENTPYSLEVVIPDGRVVTGKTMIPKVIPIDTIKYTLTNNVDDSGRYEAFVSFFWNDPQEQNNYRIGFLPGEYGDLLLGWGAADRFMTFDDEFLNGTYRNYSFFRPFKTTDTLNIYFTNIGRKEYLFWQSFGQADNNGGPFATPVILKSNINGGIGTFTGYALDYKQMIIQ